MKYIVNTYVTNDKGQFVAAPFDYDDAETAIVNYHTKLAAYHNAPDIVTAAVTITDENGVLYDTYREIVNHTVKLNLQSEGINDVKTLINNRNRL